MNGDLISSRRLYDNDAYREDFMALVYDELSGDPTNNRANRIIDAFDSAPTVDAVEVVRCRECLLRGTTVCRMYLRYRDEDDVVLFDGHWENDNDFCSWGERKEAHDERG